MYTIQSIQPTTTRQGNRRSRTTPHKERMSGSLNIETTPLTRTSQMNDITRKTKGQAKRKTTTVNGKNRQLFLIFQVHLFAVDSPTYPRQFALFRSKVYSHTVSKMTK